MLKFTVPALPTRTYKGTNAKGVEFTMVFQTVYAHTLDQEGHPLPFPEKTEIILARDALPYLAGEYHLSPASLFVDQKGRLAVAPKLLAVKAR